MKYFDYIKNLIEENRNRVLVLSVAIVAAVVIAVICFTHSTALNLADYVVIEGVSGLNSQGTISYSIDEKALKKDMFGEDKDIELTKDNVDKVMNKAIEQYEELSKLLDSIKLTVEPETGLSNGDKVTINAVLENNDYKFSKRIKNGKKTYTVNNLADGKEFDPFSEKIMTINFTGFSGKGEAELTVKESELSPYIDYRLSKSEGLCNDDIVTVTIQVDETEFEKLGYFIPEVKEKEFTVSGLLEYIDSASDIPSSSLAAFKEMALKEIQSTAKNMALDGFSVVGESEIVDSFFVKVEEPSTSHKDYWYGFDINNGVLVMTHTTVTGGFSGSSTYEYWHTYLFPDCYVTESGDFQYDTEHFTELTKTIETQDDAVQWLEEKFSGMKMTSLK